MIFPARRQGRSLARPRLLAAFAAMALGAGCVAGCTSSTSADPVGGQAAVGPAIPLTSSTVVGATTWATLAMGHLDDPLNTFWQLLTLGGGRPWRLTTPPGVASNGGLVASASPASVLAGFGPSQDLVFSPLARTDDQASSWQPGVLPAGLSPVPDSLDESGDGSVALLATAGGRVVTSTGDLSTWTPVITASTLRRQPEASGCHLQHLTAVTFDAGGGTLVGASCTRGGHPGLFTQSPTGWTSVGPAFPGVVSGPTEVVRLVRTAAGTAALVSVGGGTSARLFGLWSTDGLHAWTMSAGLPLDGASLLSTGVTADGGFVVANRSGHAAASASTVSPSGSTWRSLGTLPADASSVTATSGGGFDALVPVGSTLSVYGLSGTGWTHVQKLPVTIPYGSSG